jgi:hypothetical protein
MRRTYCLQYEILGVVKAWLTKATINHAFRDTHIGLRAEIYPITYWSRIFWLAQFLRHRREMLTFEMKFIYYELPID